MFVPVNGTKGPKAGAAVVNGEFQIPQAEGPSFGTFDVFITTDRPPYDRDTELSADRPELPEIPARYNAETELRVDTTADGPNDFDFDLTSHPYSE